MKKALTVLLGGFILLTACNDKAEVGPSYNHDNLSVYPSPAISAAHIEVMNRDGSSFLLKVIDPKGDLMLEEKKDLVRETFHLPLSGKPKGKYQVILKTDKSVYTQTFLKL